MRQVDKSKSNPLLTKQNLSILKASYVKALPQLSAPQKQLSDQRLAVLQRTNADFHGQLQGLFKEQGVDPKKLNDELKLIFRLSDPNQQEQKLAEFKQKNASFFSAAQNRFNASGLSKSLISRYPLGKNQKMRPGPNPGEMVIEDDPPPPPPPPASSDLRLAAPFSFSGLSERGDACEASDQGRLSAFISKYMDSGRRTAFVGQVLIVPAGVRSVEVTSVFSDTYFAASATVIGGYASADTHISLQLLTEGNQLLSEDRRTMANVSLPIGGNVSDRRGPQGPAVSLIGRYNRPDPAREERIHLVLTVEAWCGGGGLLGGGGSARSMGTLERFDVRLVR